MMMKSERIVVCVKERDIEKKRECNGNLAPATTMRLLLINHGRVSHGAVASDRLNVAMWIVGDEENGFWSKLCYKIRQFDV